MTINPTLLKTNNEIFIETGTFNGGGVRSALNSGYKKVISIEIHQGMYDKCSKSFEKEINSGVVELHHGDSSLLLQNIVKDITEPITFWFDAHDQSMNGGGVGLKKCPIIDELESIISGRPRELRDRDVILIEDMRLIEAAWNVNWEIDMTKFYRLIWTYNLNFNLSREDGHIPGDILMCTPKIVGANDIQVN